MIVTRPDYFDQFRCIAGDCPDSCCHEWSVQVDPEAAEFYRSLTGPLGDRLREVLTEEDGDTVMAIAEGRCPMWREDGLCRIQVELGEAALCQVCREFPRLTHDYGDFQERGLELSCPEAAKWILGSQKVTRIIEEVPGGEEADYDREAMDCLKSTREQVLEILTEEDRPVGEILALTLLYGCQAQSELDGAEPYPFDPEAALEEGAALAKPGDMEEIVAFFRSLERLTDRWEHLLAHPQNGPWSRAHLAMARYLAERYWLQAVSDYDLYSRVKLLVISCLLVKYLGGDVLETAQLFSKEIENDADNVEALLEGAYSHPAFRDDRLLGLLLGM